MCFYVFHKKKKTWNQTHFLYFHCSPCFLEHKTKKKKTSFKKHEPNRLLVSSFFCSEKHKTHKKNTKFKEQEKLLRTKKKCSLCFQKPFSVLKKQREQRKHEEYVWFLVSFCSEIHKKHRKHYIQITR